MTREIDLKLTIPRRERTMAASERHERFRLDSLEFLKKWSGELPADEMLAIASFMVGQIISMQDQKKYTSATVMEIVARNVEDGNAAAIADIKSGKISVQTH